MNKALPNFEAWFVTGSQHLYGPDTLRTVAEHSQIIARTFDLSPEIPVRVVFKPILTTPDAIYNLCLEANQSPECVGLITWMHTFSPAKMWINGLKVLQRPILHLHTQFNRDIPWGTIDMDFMNLNQSAHGDREYGFMLSRMRRDRKVVVGYWEQPDVHNQIGTWCRVACALAEWRTLKVARFGDNMREVAVTEGDKVEAQIKFGYSVNGYGVGDLVKFVNEVKDTTLNDLLNQYENEYVIAPDLQKGAVNHTSLREAARIEAGMRAFLDSGKFRAFTTTFEDLYGLVQLPGLAVQRLMADGYGFGAEGDWKTAALVRAMKVMATGLKGGVSFMEDYTYHLHPDGMKVLGAHMLEVCPSIASAKPRLELHPLGIGGKADPVRMVFAAQTGHGINVSLMDMGNRFRLLVNPCRVVAPEADLPKLPVARVLWEPAPNLSIAAASWIYAGGAHHTGFSMALDKSYFVDFADMLGIECLLIDENTTIHDFRNQIRWNEMFYALNK